MYYTHLKAALTIWTFILLHCLKRGFFSVYFVKILHELFVLIIFVPINV